MSKKVKAPPIPEGINRYAEQFAKLDNAGMDNYITEVLSFLVDILTLEILPSPLQEKLQVRVGAVKGVVMKRYPTVVDPEKGMTQKTQDFEAYKREVRTAIEKTLIKRDEQTDHYYDF